MLFRFYNLHRGWCLKGDRFMPRLTNVITATDLCGLQALGIGREVETVDR